MENFLAHTVETRNKILEEIGIKAVDELFSSIPKEALMGGLNLPDGVSEMVAQKELKRLAKKNNIDYINFMGGGAYQRFIPACVSAVSSRIEFLTAYTPYQPEISQGTLQIMYEFQTMICNLTGMDVSNASVYDGATACAEAIVMASKITKKKRVLISDGLNPEYLEVVKTYAFAGDIELEILDSDLYTLNISELNKKFSSEEYCAFVIQTPNFYGTIEDLKGVADIVHSQNSLFITVNDLISLATLKTPKEGGADVSVGDLQTLGIPLSYGGPYAGFMACVDKYKRQLPGRIVGRTTDKEEKQAFVLTLQAREQHIRREKATSNICSNQALIALMATVYLSALGEEGIRQVAYLSSKNAHYLAEALGESVLSKPFFNEFVLKIDNADDFLSYMKKLNILGGIKLSEDKVLVCTTELNDKEELDLYVRLFKEYKLM